MGPVVEERTGDCAACVAKRRHADEDWKNHPQAGHGDVAEQGWSDPGLDRRRGE